MSFSGSYRRQDVQFLLKPIAFEQFTDVPQKEALIQSGQRHYSEMLTPETLPSERYLRLFRDACDANLARMARDCLALAGMLCRRRDGPIVLVSLARAGTPVGVVLRHVLATVFRREAVHYSVSIIRDRGVDRVALDHILAQGHAPESVAFIDGWTGKGVISRELEQAVAQYNGLRGCAIDGALYVLSDLAGSAGWAPSGDDYLIPSSILNATVSGLVSRSILNQAIGPGDFHGCVYYGQFEAHDQSRAFADRLLAVAQAQAAGGLPAISADRGERAAAALVSRQFMSHAMARFGVHDANLVKPGIGEATRVLLRRGAELLIVRDGESPATDHLRALAQEKGVAVSVEPDLPYQAAALIRTVHGGGHA